MTTFIKTLYTAVVFKLKLVLSDRVLFIAMIVLPLIFASITAYTFKQQATGFVPIAVVDEDNSSYSRLIIQRLSEKPRIKVIHTSRSKAEELVSLMRVETAFVFKAGFMDLIIKGNTKSVVDVMISPDSMSHGLIGEIIAGEIVRLSSNSLAAHWVVDKYKTLQKGKVDWREVWDFTDKQWEPDPLMKMEYVERGRVSNMSSLEESVTNWSREVEYPVEVDDPSEHNNKSGEDMSIAGFIIAFIMFLVMFNSGWLLQEKQNGTLVRARACGNALKAMFLSNAVSLIILGTLQTIIFYIICSIVIGKDVFSYNMDDSNIIAKALVLLCYIVLSSAIGTILAAKLKTRTQLQAAAPVFAMLTAFMGGCFWSFIKIPSSVEMLALFTPQGIALKAIGLAIAGDFSGVGLLVAGMHLVAVFILVGAYGTLNKNYY